jgi:MFS family permease
VIVPAVPEILREFNVENQLYATLLVSIWELGEACGQTFVGPLSELYGRMPVYHTGNVLSIICSVASALSTNISMLIVFRFLNGLCVTSLTLGPSIVGDLFRKETRGSSMAITIALPMISPYFAPIVGSYTAQAKGWRWTIWIYVILIGTITCLSVLFFRETYQVKILERKAERLRKTTNNVLLRSKHQDAINKTTIIKSLTRPLMLLFCSPVVLIISFFTALTYGISYLILTTLARIMESIYGFGQGPVGLPFLGPGGFANF